jgi:hypothetical protein
MSVAVTKQHIRDLVFASCEQAGSIRKFAAVRHVSASLISATLAGERDVSTAFAATVGYMPVTRFEPISRRGRNS